MKRSMFPFVDELELETWEIVLIGVFLTCLMLGTVFTVIEAIGAK